LLIKKGLKGIHVEALQYPTQENGMEGICKAIVESQDGSEFTEVGDANPKNVNKQIAEHVLRMAATRAKARALRDFTNIGMTCLEELGELDSVIGAGGSKAKPKKRAAKKAPPKTKPQNKVTSITKSEDQPKISTAQKTAILNLGKRRGIEPDELNQMVEETFGVELSSLSSGDAASFIRNLQQAA
jgi:hypothetical protein